MVPWIFRALCLLSILALTLAVFRKNGITIEKNGFKNVLIAIRDDVPENRELLLSIQKSFTAASKFLYHATKRRAYFRDIRILVPVTWSANETYSSPDAEYFSNADITVVTGDEFHDDRPSVKTYRGCGQPGEYMEMTDLYLVDPSVTKKFGPQEKLLVHEWAHLRWGVFDEYPSDQSDPQFYYSRYSQQWEPTRCARGLTGMIKKYTDSGYQNCIGINPEYGTYDKGCAFYPYINKKTGVDVVAAIMDRQYVESIKFFCENTTDISAGHNEEAPNKHNRLCGGRSTWDVITSTADFANGNNPPRAVMPSELIPRFTVMRHDRPPTVLLALDESSSMWENRKVPRMMQAVTKFIRSSVRDGTRVGVITYRKHQRVLFCFTMINSPKERERLIAKLSLKSPYDDSSIGGALNMAASLLDDERGTVVVVTDGTENEYPGIFEALRRVVKTNIVVHSIAFTRDADAHVSVAAAKTGGKFYYDRNTYDSHEFEDAMTDIANGIAATMPNDLPQIESFAMSKFLLPGDTFKKTVYLNEGLGKQTRLVMSYWVWEPTFTVTAPSGYVYNNTSPEVMIDEKRSMVNLVIPGIAEIGEWTFSVVNYGLAREVVRLWFSSHATTRSTSTVFKASVHAASNVFPPVWTIVADAKQGGLPMLGLTIIATVARPRGSPVNIELLDNGNGADVTKDDGVYSRHFTQFTVSGRYSFFVDAQAEPGVAKLLVVKNSPKTSLLVDPEKLPVKDSAHMRKERGKQEQPFVAINGGISMVTTAGALELNLSKKHRGTKFSRDLYRPSKITDLRVIATNFDTPSVTLVWTATGDDLDVGTATGYSIYLMNASRSSAVSVNESDILSGNITNPKPSGNGERFVVRVPYDTTRGNMSLIFAVTASDDSGLSSPRSNEVAAGFGTVPQITEQEQDDFAVTTVGSMSMTTGDQTSVSMSTPAGALPQMTQQYIYIYIYIICFFQENL